MKYYYYTRWWFAGDADLAEGFYHSTWVTESRPKKFLNEIRDREFINEFFIKQFETEEEMREYWEGQK